MPKKPNYYRKPAFFHETQYGLTHSGEGIVVEYEKGGTVFGNKITYFILLRNKIRGNSFVKRDARLTSSQARNNIEIREEFSNEFKQSLLKLSFNGSPYLRENIENFLEHLEGKK